MWKVEVFTIEVNKKFLIFHVSALEKELYNWYPELYSCNPQFLKKKKSAVSLFSMEIKELAFYKKDTKIYISHI